MIQSRLFLASVAASLSFAFVAPAAADPLPPDLAEAARGYDQAQMSSDAGALGRWLADDYVLVNGGGQVFTKAQFIADSTAPGFSLKPYVVENAINKVWADAAVLAGEVSLEGADHGQPFKTRFRFADVWRKTGDRWQVVFTEVTRLTAPKQP
ncbi:nuclear transport factor 2 family protein [Phenylobacterium montanum]|uniref:nuclear transport factor 2 family protein n=1 Tax=Phenylobacterium montanum TaxID=2823693 RepID=UPI002012F9EE|nr:nuclear transport factor 2 family protein [Caulobacter sp. S6]